MSGGPHADPESPGGVPPPDALHTLTLTAVTSILVYSSQQARTLRADLEELESFYRKVLMHNLLAGWWAIPFGLIWNPMALIANRKALHAVRELGASGTAGPGWHPDPTGRHGVRYWDGSDWTDQVSDLTTDSVESSKT